MVLPFVQVTCAEDESSPDDLLLGFLAGQGASGAVLWEARISDPDGAATDQAIPNATVTDLNWGFEIQDGASLLNGTDLIVRETSTYQVKADVTMNSIPSGAFVTCGLRQVGVTTYVISSQLNSGATESYTCDFSQVVRLTAGVTYRVLVAHNSGGSRNAQEYSRFSGFRIR